MSDIVTKSRESGSGTGNLPVILDGKWSISERILKYKLLAKGDELSISYN